MTAPHFLLLLLGGLWLQPVRAGSYSLWYFYSTLSEPLPGVPQFSTLGYMDFSSESRRAGTWSPGKESNTEIRRRNDQLRQESVRDLMDQINQTGGLHLYQRIYGCDIWEDGSLGGFYQYAFDGHDFISLDKDRLTYTAGTDVAKITQDRWNSERVKAQKQKDYLEGKCIGNLKQNMNNVAESQQRDMFLLLEFPKRARRAYCPKHLRRNISSNGGNYRRRHWSPCGCCAARYCHLVCLLEEENIKEIYLHCSKPRGRSPGIGRSHQRLQKGEGII